MNATVLKGKIVHGRYLIEELLGQGGFGAVYRVRDRRVKGNIFALKEVADSSRHQQQDFLFEGEILRRLDHPALPRVYRVFEDGEDNRVYILMDYIEGPNLERLRLQQPEKRFSLPQALQIMAPIIEAVSYLHAQQPPIIHRDIKPANVIVSPLEQGAMLVDFGIAKEYDQNSTTAVIRHCSPGYGAPEQYVRGTSTQTDIYGLGATFYTLLTGEVPIDALYRITSLSAQKADPLVSVNVFAPSIPAPIADVIQRAMAINSSDRFATVQEFREALLAHLDKVQGFDLLDQRPSASFSSAITVADLSYPSDIALVDTQVPSFTGGKVWKGPHPQRRVLGRSLLVGLVALIVLALTSGMAMALGMWSGMPHIELSQRGISLTASQSQLSISPTSQKSIQDTHPSSGTGENYPSVALTYTGTVHNPVENMTAALSLVQIEQDGARIRGLYTIESYSVYNNYYSMRSKNIIDSGYFTGKATVDGNVRILITSDDSSLSHLLEGQLAPDGSISGTYCSYRHHHCDDSTNEYGDWHVTPQAG